MKLHYLGLVALACGGRLIETPARVGDANARRVEGIVQFTLRNDWVNSGYFRPDQDAVIALPVLVGIDAAGSACILTSAQWAAWEVPGDVIACRTAWRIPRGNR